MNDKKIPSPWLSTFFLLWAALFITWQPFVWWRGLGALMSLIMGLTGFWLWWKYRRNSKNETMGPQHKDAS